MGSIGRRFFVTAVANCKYWSRIRVHAGRNGALDLSPRPVVIGSLWLRLVQVSAFIVRLIWSSLVWCVVTMASWYRPQQLSMNKTVNVRVT